jgi:hypothetical protein
MEDFLKPLDPRRKNLERDQAVIEIIASDGVQEAYTTLVSSRRLYHMQLLELRQCARLPACDFGKFKKDCEEQQGEYFIARIKLIVAARRDMGSE